MSHHYLPEHLTLNRVPKIISRFVPQALYDPAAITHVAVRYRMALAYNQGVGKSKVPSRCLFHVCIANIDRFTRCSFPGVQASACEEWASASRYAHVVCGGQGSH